MPRGTADDVDGYPADDQQLARLPDMPQLARLVPHLAPEVLHQVIRRIGIEGCVDLVEAATAEQLTAIGDLDLWGATQPGCDEQLDIDRFGEWVESLVDRDAATAARVVARLDLSLVVTGLSQYVRVLDSGVLEPAASTDDESWYSGLFVPEGLSADIGGYIVQGRRKDAWDAIVSLLVELSAEQDECFHAVMRGCRRFSDAERELDGLDDLLEQPEQLLHDVAVDRARRRADRGFHTAAAARAFLAMARQRRSPGRHENPIAVACLRRAEATSIEGPGYSMNPRAAPYRLDARVVSARRDPIVVDELSEFVRAFAVDRLPSERPRALLGGGHAGQHEPGSLQQLMEYLHEQHPDVCHTRTHEIAFLANTLVAGCRLQSRSPTPQESLDAVVATCGLGLLRQPVVPDVDYLISNDLIAVFEDGWAALHREVSLFVGAGLLAILRGASVGHSDTLDGLYALRRSLETHLAAGTPWLAHEALDVLSTLDTPAWHGLLGLLSECPVLPAVVTVIVERRTGPIDPNAFVFIATAAHVQAVHTFMARLPQLLAE